MNSELNGLSKRILFTRGVIDSLLSYAKAAYPDEGILLLRGKNKRDEIRVESVVIPPLAVHARSFSSFPIYMLPFDISIVGTAHSHPSGTIRPSLDDLNNFYGRIMAIMGYPYESEEDIGVFDSEGERLIFQVI